MATNLEVCIGKRKEDNKPYLITLNKAPHVLIGGTTGSGKSYLLHEIIAQLISKYNSKVFDLYLGDPKRVEFACYNNDVHVAMIANTAADHDYMLTKLIDLMENRYVKMAEKGLKNLDNYQFARNIVVVIDEFGDLVLDKVVGKRITEKLVKLVQLGRAAAITVILATQHPTTEVVDSRIKANCPTRIALKVTSQVNSRVILDEGGAEKLTGKGHMFLLNSYETGIKELHGYDIFASGCFNDCMKISQSYGRRVLKTGKGA